MSKKSFSYGNLPTIRIPRSQFDLSFGHKTTMKVGELVPIYCDLAYAGDTYRNHTSAVIRSLNSFQKPVMDNCFLDTFFFAVPCRILYDKWEEVFGASSNPWKVGSATVPTLGVSKAYTGEETKQYLGSLLDYFGDIAPGTPLPANWKVSQLPYRAYAKVVNDWFRDENQEYDVVYNSNSLNGNLTVGGVVPYGINNIFAAKPYVVNKVHDRFTSTLPAPQKGDAVEVIPNSKLPVKFDDAPTSDAFQIGVQVAPIGSGGVSQFNEPVILGAGTSQGQGSVKDLEAATSTAMSGTTFGGGAQVAITNAYADLVSAVSVNDLRFAFQLQKQLERFARGGSARYTEYIQSTFGVQSPDARLQRSEYLGGKRSPLSIQQVAQTSSSIDGNPLADLGAYSLSGSESGFSKSFTEHTIILGVACIRYYHTYQQGIDAWHKRFKRIDFYDPTFANIGEQPVYKSELYAGANSTDIFGYNEYMSDMRYKENKISGALRSGCGAKLDFWHFGDYYSAAPTLNRSFMKENSEPIDRALAFTVSDTTPPFILDIWFRQTAIRPMPLYSVPSLIDHH